MLTHFLSCTIFTVSGVTFPRALFLRLVLLSYSSQDTNVGYKQREEPGLFMMYLGSGWVFKQYVGTREYSLGKHNYLIICIVLEVALLCKHQNRLRRLTRIS